MIFKKMKKFEILEHKADLKIRVFGKDLRELFLNAIVGMFEEAGYESEGEEIKREIKISSLDLPSLLVDFLSEVLYLCEVNREVYHKVLFKNLTEKELKGILIGKPLKRMGVHIKAVTYHDLDIHQKEDKTWQATILFDI
ncbi:MAG: hypothetical protein CO145_00515 [Candidatus Nealsonbacteria bacterium CG_4_9_14_3_um_filter_37_13]|uniref:Archease domain-containing protein n=1 Tax=Candidatus Nealsonbacteria bacterium CG_4_9_14_3_um_filter_37_13 TaxID=1974695 RepID=A0A2M7Z5R4_9BACT|nr:MAG: hypothetical protein CO145_00515 [Candidatus Nealsonbacteria bacterium CG_4_9_14_3_um_filter_37_13]